jgi:hypothetical protein
VTKLAGAHITPNTQSRACPSHTPHQNDGNEASTGSEDFATMAHKLEFPKLDGSSDPLPWLNRCE